jgi:hypothetical protein
VCIDILLLLHSLLQGDEWDEKWGEHYHASGKVAKFADKWGKTGPNVWHERWGEDYDSGGDACVKWTDKWAERLLPDGAREQWGDKWHEAFANGRGEKNGEVRGFVELGKFGGCSAFGP